MRVSPISGCCRGLVQNHNIVFDRGNTARGPGIFTSLAFFFPRMGIASEGYLTIVDCYRDILSIRYGSAFERILDRGFDFSGGSNHLRFNRKESRKNKLPQSGATDGMAR